MKKTSWWVFIACIVILFGISFLLVGVPTINERAEQKEYDLITQEIMQNEDAPLNEFDFQDTDNDIIQKLPGRIENAQIEYPDMVGWITIQNSYVNYPVMASEGNYYLNHAPSGKQSSSGSIFCYENQILYPDNKMDKNIVFYGHHLRSSSMFGYLETIYNKNYVRDKNKNQIIFITNAGTYIYEMFSSYKINKAENFGRINFANDSDFIEYCMELKSRSNVENTTITDFSGQDRIITLVSCTYGRNQSNMRVVVHAKLTQFVPDKQS